jgi:hypothetical protein
MRSKKKPSPLRIAAPSGFTPPTRVKRSESLTLEVVEDWQPSSVTSTSRTDGPHTALLESKGRRPRQEVTGEQDDSLEADLQLEAELAKGLADLDTPVPGPSRQPRSRAPDVANSPTNALPVSRPPARLELEVTGAGAWENYNRGGWEGCLVRAGWRESGESCKCKVTVPASQPAHMIYHQIPSSVIIVISIPEHTYRSPKRR